MNPILNLHILAKRYTQLSKSAFFDPSFKDFAAKTAAVIEHVTANSANYPESVVRQFESHVWRAMQFVRGSRSNDAPHETQFVLRQALKEWIPDDALISSASLEYFDYFLNPADLWEFVEHSLNLFDAKGYRPLLVRIGSPEAFKHRPVFCIPLFHELGHFVDHHYKISELSMILAPPGAPPPGITASQWQFINLRHRMEHFADLFGSCYCGEASNKSLLAIAPGNPDSPTHPATDKRVAVVRDYLNSTQNGIVDLFQMTLQKRSLQTLQPRFTEPDVRGAFDDVVTYRIKDVQELYGIFSSAWDYLHDQVENKKAPWIDDQIGDYEVEKTVNDLVEKSIRNFEIRERWSGVVADGK